VEHYRQSREGTELNRILLFLAALLLVPPAQIPAAEAPKAKPNIVFLLVDDMPYAGLSLTGNPYLQTPNMDRIAKEGMFFTRAYSQPVCGPSRADIMTGQTAGRHGRTDNVPGVHPHALMQEPLGPAPTKPGLPFDLVQSARLPDAVRPDTYTVVRALQSAGYKTAISGKWHLEEGHLTPAQARELGFDFCNESADRTRPYRDTQRFTDDAIRFMRENRDHPFFLYLATVAVHGPHIVPPEDKARWAEKLKGKNPGLSPDMLAGLEFVDASVGRVLDAITELGLAKNTLVVLASDNGGVAKTRYSEANRPFREGKGTHYEGGVRVPLAIRWPGHIPPDSRCDVPVQFADFLPTFCEAAGVTPDSARPLDGMSLFPLFAQGTLPDRTFFLTFPHYMREYAATPVRTVIQNRYKLVWHPFDHIEIDGDKISDRTLRYVAEPRIELFDLLEDPSERQNLAQKMPGKVAELQKLYEEWMEKIGAKNPVPNPGYDPADPLFNARDAELKKQKPSTE
jgi:uncharacterized sulfatase